MIRSFNSIHKTRTTFLKTNQSMLLFCMILIFYIFFLKKIHSLFLSLFVSVWNSAKVTRAHFASKSTKDQFDNVSSTIESTPTQGKLFFCWIFFSFFFFILLLYF